MFVDANVFIFAILDGKEKGTRCRNLLDSIAHGQKATTSCLVIDEIMWSLMRNRRANLIEMAVKNLYEMPNLEIVAVPFNAPLSAVKNMMDFQLKPRDAMHLATMQHYGISSIATDDADFEGVKGIKKIIPK